MTPHANETAPPLGEIIKRGVATTALLANAVLGIMLLVFFFVAVGNWIAAQFGHAFLPVQTLWPMALAALAYIAYKEWTREQARIPHIADPMPTTPLAQMVGQQVQATFGAYRLEEQKRIATEVAKMIEAQEPRLKQLVVAAVQDAARRGKLQ